MNTNVNFPFQFDGRGRTLNPQENYLRQLVEQVLFTSPGERVNLPDFGSGLLQLLFAPYSLEMAAATEFTVQAALQKWPATTSVCSLSLPTSRRPSSPSPSSTRPSAPTSPRSRPSCTEARNDHLRLLQRKPQSRHPRQSTINGIDYLEVLDHDAIPLASPRQRTLLLHFLNPIPKNFSTTNILITGGESITNIAVQWVAPTTNPPAPPLANAQEAAFFSAMPDAAKVLVVRVNEAGDFSPLQAAPRQRRRPGP
jgi:phage baseplate assembly protein W